MNSRFETVAGELRATLLRRRRGLATIPVAAGTAPVTWRCTRYVALHPIRTGAMPTDRVHRTTLEYPKEESAAPHASPTDRNTRSHKTPKNRRCGGRRRVRRARLRCPWAVASRPDNEATRRAKLAARAARVRAAAHRHTQRPGPPAPGTPAGPQAPRLKHSSPLPADPAPRMKHYSPTHTQNG